MRSGRRNFLLAGSRQQQGPPCLGGRAWFTPPEERLQPLSRSDDLPAAFGWFSGDPLLAGRDGSPLYRPVTPGGSRPQDKRPSLALAFVGKWPGHFGEVDHPPEPIRRDVAGRVPQPPAV